MSNIFGKSIQNPSWWIAVVEAHFGLNYFRENKVMQLFRSHSEEVHEENGFGHRYHDGQTGEAWINIQNLRSVN